MTNKQEKTLVNQWITFFDKYIWRQNKKVQRLRSVNAVRLFCCMKGITPERLRKLELKHIEITLRLWEL